MRSCTVWTLPRVGTAMPRGPCEVVRLYNLVTLVIWDKSGSFARHRTGRNLLAFCILHPLYLTDAHLFWWTSSFWCIQRVISRIALAVRPARSTFARRRLIGPGSRPTKRGLQLDGHLKPRQRRPKRSRFRRSTRGRIRIDMCDSTVTSG